MTTPINDQNELLRRELADVRVQLATVRMDRDAQRDEAIRMRRLYNDVLRQRDDALPDARRFNAWRRISQCRDEAKLEQLDRLLQRVEDCPDQPTVEQFDAFFDYMVATVNGLLGAE